MKAVTALVTINERVILKVLLEPETQQEIDFLKEVEKKATTADLSISSVRTIRLEGQTKGDKNEQT